MNLKQAAILDFSFNELLHDLDRGKAKRCVWSFNNELFTASFYKNSPFKDGKKLFSYNEAFSKRFPRKDSFTDPRIFWLNNLPLFINDLKNFILSDQVDEDDLVENFVLTNVSFFKKDLGNFSFYLFPEDAQIEIVSAISVETLDQNV
ncbi:MULTISPECIES: hypothetical protein [Lactiplantibacillus]|uniref:Uncharacterized protein n=1 Tax=Lactiplantibacillus dongliensis TaxID=2559919 RepID=A0ABW1R917_9LACO|nr:MULTISPECIES: hypothetical protein [Lactiplantibacillus]ASX21866.1 hypothetical protein BGV74_08740 [Lactiplantibacillus plantarum]WMY71863.1 hypothetical protein RF634_06605 [Lactiplantibacillus plantarum]